MDNIVCEPSETYSTSRQLWTSKYVNYENLPLIGGYGLYITESIMILLSKKSIERENPLDTVFGIWKDADVTLEQIREKTWERNS